MTRIPDSLRTPGSLALAAALLLSLAGAFPAEAQSTKARLRALQKGQEQIRRDIERACKADDGDILARVRQSPTISSRQTLQTTLKISSNRAEAIFIGDKGKKNVIGFLAANGGGGRLGYTCDSHGCSCHGDDDCNLMFTQVCKNPSTNGSCTGEVCTCTP